jgi:hypothetical protein
VKGITMAEAQAMEVQKQKVVGFAKRNTKEDKIKQEEKEIEELQKAIQETGDQPVKEEVIEPEPDNAEERSFKKRYGDLRRFAQKKEGDLQKQIDELKSQLETATKQQIKLPKSEEELEAWATEYPDVAKIVETIAIKKSQEQAKELEDRIKKINDMQDDALREKAEVELLKKHPDFADIRDQDEFHNWVEIQPQWVQKALYENQHDAMSASRAIDLYKADMGITGKKSNKQIEKEVAKSVKVSSKESPEAMAEGSTFKESEVEKMQPAEYEAKQDAIIAAMRSGNFIYDLTGSAR